MKPTHLTSCLSLFALTLLLTVSAAACKASPEPVAEEEPKEEPIAQAAPPKAITPVTSEQLAQGSWTTMITEGGEAKTFTYDFEPNGTGSLLVTTNMTTPYKPNLIGSKEIELTYPSRLMVGFTYALQGDTLTLTITEKSAEVGAATVGGAPLAVHLSTLPSSAELSPETLDTMGTQMGKDVLATEAMQERYRAFEQAPGYDQGATQSYKTHVVDPDTVELTDAQGDTLTLLKAYGV